MKFVRITESDRNYVEKFTSFLVQLGARPLPAEPLIFEVEDDFDADAWHGIELSNEKPLDPEQQHAREFAWVRAYSGTFDFYLSLKAQLRRKGTLSPNQLAAVQRAIARDEERAKAEALPKVYAIKPGMVLILSQFIAQEVARNAGYKKPQRAFEVVEVHRETARAYQVTLKFSAQRTNYCGICGRHLENGESIRNGIGPICAEKTGVSFTGNALHELADILVAIPAVKAWVPKGSIKNLEELTGEKLPEPAEVD